MAITSRETGTTDVKCLTRFALMSIALLAAGQTLAQQVVILYPMVREPYARIYRDTLTGIEQTYEGDSRALPVQPAPGRGQGWAQ